MFTWLKRRREQGVSSTVTAPDAKAVAMYIVYNLMIDRTASFGVPSEKVASIAANLPESVQETFGSWAQFYVAWRLIERAGEKHGIAFRSDVTALVPASIDPIQETDPDTNIIIGYIRKLFDMMDETRREGDLVKIGGYDMPIVGRVALNLIVLEGGEEEVKAKASFAIDLALALEELHGLAAPHFDHALALTAEKQR